MILLNIELSRELKGHSVPWNAIPVCWHGTVTRHSLLEGFGNEHCPAPPHPEQAQYFTFHAAFAVLPGFEFGRVAGGLVQE